jgi:hypothetical protein
VVAIGRTAFGVEHVCRLALEKSQLCPQR